MEIRKVTEKRNVTDKRERKTVTLRRNVTLRFSVTQLSVAVIYGSFMERTPDPILVHFCDCFQSINAERSAARSAYKLLTHHRPLLGAILGDHQSDKF